MQPNQLQRPSALMLRVRPCGTFVLLLQHRADVLEVARDRVQVRLGGCGPLRELVESLLT